MEARWRHADRQATTRSHWAASELGSRHRSHLDVSQRGRLLCWLQVGERSVLDVLTARQSLLNAEIKYFQEQKDREITKAQVMYMSGILNLSSLGIN